MVVAESKRHPQSNPPSKHQKCDFLFKTFASLIKSAMTHDSSQTQNLVYFFSDGDSMLRRAAPAAYTLIIIIIIIIVQLQEQIPAPRVRDDRAMSAVGGASPHNDQRKKKNPAIRNAAAAAAARPPSLLCGIGEQLSPGWMDAWMHGWMDGWRVKSPAPVRHVCTVTTVHTCIKNICTTNKQNRCGARAATTPWPSRN